MKKRVKENRIYNAFEIEIDHPQISLRCPCEARKVGLGGFSEKAEMKNAGPKGRSIFAGRPRKVTKAGRRTVRGLAKRSVFFGKENRCGASVGLGDDPEFQTGLGVVNR